MAPSGPKLRCTVSTSVPRHMQCMHRSKESALRPWPCAPPSTSISWNHSFSLNQCVANVDSDANACQRTVVNWCRCLWKWRRLNTHLNMSKPTSVSSHKIQRWTCKPWTESCCQSLNLPGYSLLAPPTLAQPVSCLNASPTPSSCFPPMTTPLWSILFDMVALQECSSAPPQVNAVLISVMLNLVLSPQA